MRVTAYKGPGQATVSSRRGMLRAPAASASADIRRYSLNDGEFGFSFIADHSEAPAALTRMLLDQALCL